jgi:hypothetical protein
MARMTTMRTRRWPRWCVGVFARVVAVLIRAQQVPAKRRKFEVDFDGIAIDAGLFANLDDFDSVSIDLVVAKADAILAAEDVQASEA